MACPACGCKVTYQYDDEDAPDDDLYRCAACGAIFPLEDETPEYDEQEEMRRAEYDAEMRLDAFGPVHG